MLRLGFALVALVLLSSCAEPDYEASFGWVLETHYADGVPFEQAQMLDDGEIAATEVAAAATARDECVASIDGVVWVEDFEWKGDLDFAGGEYRIADDADAAIIQAQAEQCFFDNVALVEAAWFDQEILGGWTNVNLID